MLLKIFPLKSAVTFRSGLPWRLLISFYSVLHHFRGFLSLFNTLGLLILPIDFGLHFLCIPFHPHLLATAASGRLLLQPYFFGCHFFGCHFYMTGLSEMTMITSTCKSSFSSALKRCSSLESYLCLPRSDRILIFFQNFGT